MFIVRVHESHDNKSSISEEYIFKRVFVFKQSIDPN